MIIHVVVVGANTKNSSKVDMTFVKYNVLVIEIKNIYLK